MSVDIAHRFDLGEHSLELHGAEEMDVAATRHPSAERGSGKLSLGCRFSAKLCRDHGAAVREWCARA